MLVLLLVAQPCRAVENWYLEIREPDIDVSVARRSVGLELHDLVVPGNPRQPQDTPEDVSLYFRVERQEGKLSVLLWDRGQFISRRGISDGGEAKILARRVGLAAAELTHDLMARRSREAAQLKREQLEAARFAAAEKERQRRKAFALETGVFATGLTQGAWLLGPRVGAQLNSYFPVRFSLSLGWAAGEVSALRDATWGGGPAAWSVWELGLGASYGAELGPRLRWNCGARVAADAVHVGGPAFVDQIVGQRDTWTARVGLETGLEQKFSSLLGVGLHLEVGTMLRRIPLQYGAEQLDLGGLFLGGSLRFLIVPG